MKKNLMRITGRARGFSLIELMIAMTIGLVISLVVGQLFIGSRQAFTSTDSLSRVQENSRYALTVISREMRSASFRSDPRVPRATAYPAGTTPSLNGTDGGGTASDLITVRFQGSGNGTGTPDGTMQDCVGNRIDYGTAVVNTFFVQNDTSNLNNDNAAEPTLFCNSTGTGTCAVGAAGCYALVPGVENMQIVYGEDTGAQPYTTNPDGSIDRWIAAGSVSNWDNVLSVRISLLLRTDNRVGQTTDTRAYAMSGTSVSAPGNDTRLRRVFTSVINLRNRTQ
jgi:type IV pilus assembly protein PilW